MAHPLPGLTDLRTELEQGVGAGWLDVRGVADAGRGVVAGSRGRDLEYVSANEFNAAGHVVKAGEHYRVLVDYLVKRLRPR
jgi:hypothetical protein